MRHKKACGGRDGNERDVDQEERPAHQILATYHRGKQTEGDYKDHPDRHPQGWAQQTKERTKEKAAHDGQ